jgi:hypothetical protein
MGSGIPDTLRGFGLMMGAWRGGWLDRDPFRTNGDSGDAPLIRASGWVIPRCCWRFETSDTRDVFWLSYGEEGLMARWFIPAFMRLSTLPRRESVCEPASKLARWSKPWLSDGRAFDCKHVSEAAKRKATHVPGAGLTGTWPRMACQELSCVMEGPQH